MEIIKGWNDKPAILLKEKTLLALKKKRTEQDMDRINTSFIAKIEEENPGYVFDKILGHNLDPVGNVTFMYQFKLKPPLIVLP